MLTLHDCGMNVLNSKRHTEQGCGCQKAWIYVNSPDIECKYPARLIDQTEGPRDRRPRYSCYASDSLISKRKDFLVSTIIISVCAVVEREVLELLE